MQKIKSKIQQELEDLKKQEDFLEQEFHDLAISYNNLKNIDNILNLINNKLNQSLLLIQQIETHRHSSEIGCQ